MRRFIALCSTMLLLCPLLCLSKPLYLMDTDMGFDDWLAVLYLLNQRDADIAAITVDCQGLSRCPQGGSNLQKLVTLAHRPVNIAMGKSRPVSHYDFPKVLRDFSSAMDVPEFKKLAKPQQPVATNAAQLIVNSLVSAANQHRKITLISIGTATNIADAWQLAVTQGKQAAFRQGLAVIVKGGGAFGELKQGHPSNVRIRGNISIPGIVQSNNTSAEWNIYANAPAMQTLLDANLPLTFVPNNATDAINMTQAAYNALQSGSEAHGLRRFVANAMLSVIQLQGGWDKIADNLDFWDTSVTIAALSPQIVLQQSQQVPVRVELHDNDLYGSTVIDGQNEHLANIIYRLNKPKFYKILLSHLQG